MATNSGLSAAIRLDTSGVATRKYGRPIVRQSSGLRTVAQGQLNNSCFGAASAGSREAVAAKGAR